MMKVGVLGLQGDVSEHLEALEKLGAKGAWVKDLASLAEAEALIIPGGESTTIGRLLEESWLFEMVQQRAKGGMPIFGTCAGLILLAKEAGEQARQTGQRLLGLMDMEVDRNAFGRQRESFEQPIEINGLGQFPGVFIRAPAIRKVFGKCEALAQLDGRIIAARQGKLLATAFHPELTGDLRLHRYFLEQVY
ncbi:MAG: pyridoxal 5'-phosphate synthase glutaminase subunit PdxT [Candidatus Aenigmarchaeota archaeon]|nr:pyridoxal 5'-phosphate synthase glutaminase subunit PdxT [Candidatus Aenigmarchaeota archaeon]